MVTPLSYKTLDSHLESSSVFLKQIRGSYTYLQSQRYHLAQPVVKERALFGIEPVWEKPTLEPPLRWDRWQIMLKLAIVPKEGISIDTLREDPLRTRLLYPLNLYTRIMLKIAHPRSKEIGKLEMSNLRTRG